MNTNSPRKSPDTSTECPDLPTKFRQACRRVVPEATSLAVWLAFIALASGSVAAQSSVGDVYCGTGVETGIGIVFGAVAGLGLPATGFYVGRAGLSYMRAGGNPEKKNQAKERLVMSGVGFGIIVLALISPELIDKVGSQMGFGFSDCVKPF
ncbi:pilin [Natrinema limicola]|uniref:pilin n=1 Tax=Natrinema limicola TaxID=370323 RepID=UPI000677979A